MQISANLKQLEYHEVVAEQIRIINKILVGLGAQSILENSDVTFDDWWQFEVYLKFKLFRANSNSVMLDFHLMSDGMRNDFEAYDEAHEFSLNDILEKEDKVTEVLKRLISCPILVEYKGRTQFVNLFNEDGSRYSIWSLGTFLSLFTRGYWKSQLIDQHLFFPIYPSQK